MKAFLIVILISAQNGGLKSSTPAESLEQCFEMLAKVTFHIGPGDENETGGVAFCSFHDHAMEGSWSGSWHGERG